MEFLIDLILEAPKDEVKESLVALDIPMRLTASFSCEPKGYGNGYHLLVKDESSGVSESIDLRYDKDFDAKYKIAYLEKLARNYWTGENGSYRIKQLGIREIKY